MKRTSCIAAGLERCAKKSAHPTWTASAPGNRTWTASAPGNRTWTVSALSNQAWTASAPGTQTWTASAEANRAWTASAPGNLKVKTLQNRIPPFKKKLIGIGSVSSNFLSKWFSIHINSHDSYIRECFNFLQQ